MSLLFMSQCIFCAESNYSSETSIGLANKFVTKLRANTPFLYEDEVAFFGELTMYSYVILHKLGYVNDSGQWIKSKPKYSYLGELIRLNSNFILLENPKEEYFFSGRPNYVTKDGLYEDDTFYAKIAFIQIQGFAQDGPVGNIRNIIIEYGIPKKKLDFPILIDGKPLVEYLGFIRDSKGVSELGKNELDKLVKHIAALSK